MGVDCEYHLIFLAIENYLTTKNRKVSCSKSRLGNALFCSAYSDFVFPIPQL